MKAIEIVDRGRGPQLSTCRITVQDLVPYLQEQWTHAQILAIMPILKAEEIQAIDRYVLEHHAEVMEQDRRIRERIAARRPPPEIEESLRQERRERLESFRRQIRLHKPEPNGDPASSGRQP